jgi:hypothetical protein
MTQLRTITEKQFEAALREAKAEALTEAANAWREYLPAVAGYGAVQPVPVWLHRRADWLRIIHSAK